MSTPSLAADHNLEFLKYIEEEATRSKELRQATDRILELRPHDKSIQKLDHIVDVLVVKLSAVSIRATRSSRKPVSGAVSTGRCNTI
jgi:hypothetical protein